ncbi:hypothetical protein [Sphingomonas sp. PAMC 26605]|uniref:hypothetical protein n=1 Tax=Sphingomonas sp. PAMC 26605 TaxID=1112214 RepID=UPI00026CB58E|nr:hypothetical protein [Sphingomonas sp. PAMC 26605]
MTFDRQFAKFKIGGAALAAMLALVGLPGVAQAAKSDGCPGGGFTVSGFSNGAVLGTSGLKTTAQASLIQPTLTVTGRYNTFDITSDSFAVRNYAFTGVANPEDLTGGHRTTVFQEKTPDHRGLVLNGAMTVEIDGDSLVITRTGPGLSMQIQAKDCAAGGVFQMEVERGDGTATRITHVLAPGAFFYDNPNFRARQGDVVPFKDTTIAVTPRINIGNDVSAKFIARDSSQVATRVDDPTCPNPIQTRTGAINIVKHCGRVSKWDVSSGGRLGFVTGEDATEVAPPPTVCTHKCQAQNQVQGQSVILGAPFPVPTESRLKPDLS